MPDDYVMAFRTSLLLRGFSYLLHYKFSHAQSWKDVAKRVLAEDAPPPPPSSSVHPSSA